MYILLISTNYQNTVSSKIKEMMNLILDLSIFSVYGHMTRPASRIKPQAICRIPSYMQEGATRRILQVVACGDVVLL